MIGHGNKKAAFFSAFAGKTGSNGEYTLNAPAVYRAPPRRETQPIWRFRFVSSVPLNPSPSLFDGKICSTCGQWKPIDAGYAKQACLKSGYRARCKECTNKTETQLSMKRLKPASLVPEGVRTCAACGETKACADFYLNLSSKNLTSSKCKLCYRAATYARRKGEGAEWHEATEEYMEGWREKHRAEIAAYFVKYRAENPHRTRAHQRRYKTSPKGKAQYHTRRARRLMAGDNFTGEQWDALCTRFHHRCLRCGRETKLTADHIVPLAKGGGNDITNIQPLCPQCNSSKGTKTIDYRTSVEYQ